MIQEPTACCVLTDTIGIDQSCYTCFRCELSPRSESIKVAGTPILGHFLCLISLYLQNYAVVGIYKINFDCSENNLH